MATLKHPAPSRKDYFESEVELDELVQQFQQLSLPKEAWTHQAHLCVGTWYLSHYTKSEATCFLRSGIITYNASLGGTNDPQNGYHETITLFWIWVLHNFVQQTNGSAYERCNKLVNSRYSGKQLPFLFFSRDRLLSVAARANWVEPDHRALDFELI